MKQLKLLILLFVLTYQSSFAQLDSVLYNHAFTINLNDLLIKRLLITYSRPLNTSIYMENSIGYMYSDIQMVDAGSYIYFKDAFWYYNNFSIRGGIRKYLQENSYLSLSLCRNYKFFEDIRFNRYEDWEGELADRDFVISRFKIQYGLVLKGGLVKRKGQHFIMDSYIGVGAYYSTEGQSIKAIFDSEGNLQNETYPIESKNSKFVPTLNFGISIGFSK